MEFEKPVNYLHAQRSGVKFAILKLSEKPEHFTCSSLREALLLRISMRAIEHRAQFRSENHMRSATTDHTSLFEGFRNGAQFVIDELPANTLYFLTEKTLENSIAHIKKEIDNLSPKIFS